ncbi:hypothetical protein G5714_017931 [Onychostoma macrolepis]|uniref:Uncharacterized protein n=2 Tax=Onychostoma macrolepis TaxID=369639 RepID=A0A7J6C2I5_9TELE|nr:hypothetical protein G5714_017931 [Onychostoma macrolepis]
MKQPRGDQFPTDASKDVDILTPRSYVIAKEKFSIPPETNIYVLDDSGTEVDEEVFSDILEEKSDILWTIVNVLSVSDSPVQSSCTDTLSLSSHSSDSDAFVMSPKSLQTDDSSSQAKELVKRILEQKPGGEKILAKYAMTGEMKDRACRDLVSIVVAEMFDKYGRAPPMEKRAQYALGIVTLFPSLKDPYSKKGYREKVQQLEGDQCREAISLLKHTTDNEQTFLKMRETFQHRQKLIHDPEQCSTVLTVFPRFLDTKGLVVQDFDLLFGAETSSKLLEKWDFLKGKVIEQAKDLSKTPLLDHLIQSAEENTDEDDEVPGWDSDMASLLLLVYLLPPPPSGKKGAVKISTREAVDHVVKFHKSCRSLQEHSGPNQRRQPYILAVGTTRKHIHEYYIALDGDLLPCKGKSSLSAFDELFKAHYVFGISYDQALNGMYTFVQTTIYNIDVGHSHETPREHP